jgi:hypothetical protein
MTRWRLIVVVLVMIALVLWGSLSILNLRPEYGQGLPRPDLQASNSNGLEEPLSRLPSWVSSLGLFVTLLLAGIANFYLFPTRVRNMRRALTLSWARLIQLVLLGFGFILLILGFGIGAALARVTFPFSIIAAVSTFFLSVWGYLSLVYACGRGLLNRTGWQMSSPSLSLILGLLLLLPLVRIPYVGIFFVVVYLSLGLGLVITTHFGSNEPWDLTPLLEEVRK